MNMVLWILFLIIFPILLILLIIIYFCLHKPLIPPPFIKDDKIFFIGLPGQGKTKLFHKLSGKNQDSKEPFNHWKLKNTNFSIVNTPSIEFDDNIERKEQIIELFQIHLKEISYRVSLFLIFVKFRRTETMVNNIIAIYKYFNKFKNIIRIIVTDFHLSKSEKVDKAQLQEEFKQFVNDKQKHILFFGNDTPKEDIVIQLQDQVKDINETEPINLKLTILDEIQENKVIIQMNKTYQMVSQNDNQ